MIGIKGFEKNSLIDYPGKMCSVVFVGGCNFRCPFCHNKNLVIGHEILPNIPIDDILRYMISKRKWVDGVCVTGGEPTIHSDLPLMLKKFKSKGFLVKIDTNGTNPRMLNRIISDGVVDYIAMDIKAPMQRYEDVAKARVSKDDLQLSIDIIRNSGIGYEFRTTVVPILHTVDDMVSIGRWLQGSKRYVLQQFRPGNNLSEDFSGTKPYEEKTLKEMAEKVRPYFGEVEIRV